jgi:hypothetical protein
MTAAKYISAMPAPASPMVDPATGIVSPAWWAWMRSMWTRTGGGTGSTMSALAGLVANQSAPGVPVTLGASPFVYTAPSHGQIMISGGGVVRLEITANGSTWFNTGAYYGAFPLASGSQARLTYVGTPPGMTFIPT